MKQRGEEYADVVAQLLVRVYEIHDKVMTVGGGGLEGIRDASMLHSAVARPFATFDGKELYPTDLEKAAALFHSLIKSHPFMDGTKRTAFTSAVYFLQARGYAIRRNLPKDEVIRFCVEIAMESYQDTENVLSNKITLTEIVIWFEKYILKPL